MESISVTIRKQSVFSLYCRDKTTTSCDRAKGKGGYGAVSVQPQQTNSLAPSATACRFCSAHPVKGNIPANSFPPASPYERQRTRQTAIPYNMIQHYNKMEKKMRDELMSEIIKLEWEMFSHVSNVGGPASCQMRPDTFKIMRKSQAATWSDELLASYLEDLKAATRDGRNIMTEKYARMMESTFPEEYRKLAASLPPVDRETLRKIEEIVAINVSWKAELFDRYPRLSGKGRPLRTSEDSAMETSFETYLRGELKTYSARTITLLHELTLRQQQDGVNGAELNLLNQVQQYGYATLEQAEGHRAGA